MSEHGATVLWRREGAVFTDRRYSRGHRWRFDGGVVVPASSSPHVVPVPLSDASAVDPEEAYVAALASCHMLWFLDLASRRGFRVDTYSDEAVGEMGRDAEGRTAMIRVRLNPHTVFSGPAHPSSEEVAALHHEAHERCYLANSVKSAIEVHETFEVV